MVGWPHQLNGHEFEQTPGVVTDREAWRTAHGEDGWEAGMRKNEDEQHVQLLAEAPYLCFHIFQTVLST